MLIYPTIKMSPLLGLQGSGGGLGYLAPKVSGPEIGEFYEGGYFAGYISQSNNGVATHGLIVSPKASGSYSDGYRQFKTSNSNDGYGNSVFDGAGNTASQAASGDHPAASYCAGLTINTYSDWYLPARYELYIAYYNLKPTTENNDTGHGVNSYAVPPLSSNYTNSPRNPDQTTVSVFQDGSSEFFRATEYWSSTQHTSSTAWQVRFNDGTPSNVGKDSDHRVRAFRKFAV